MKKFYVGNSQKAVNLDHVRCAWVQILDLEEKLFSLDCLHDKGTVSISLYKGDDAYEKCYEEMLEMLNLPELSSNLMNKMIDEFRP